ncbi:hypothetical protein [Mycobacterium parmense]|nr:hypothetical protein [Mycobacterium parmense]
MTAHEAFEEDPADTADDVTLAVAKLNAGAHRADSALAGRKPRWQATEEEILRGAITVILVALLVVIGVATGAILTPTG